MTPCSCEWPESVDSISRVGSCQASFAPCMDRISCSCALLVSSLGADSLVAIVQLTASMQAGLELLFEYCSAQQGQLA